MLVTKSVGSSGRWVLLAAWVAMAGCGGVSVEPRGDGGADSGSAKSSGAGSGSPKSSGAGPGGVANPKEPGGGGAAGGSSAGNPVTEPGGASGGSAPNQYPGRGFIVHEWGTDTVVVGSDGTLQRGLQHEEEDLPAFVYDRMKAGPLLGTEPSVTIKMETPVTYFYSDAPLQVEASVQFPKGVLTQWYPAVTSFSPAIAAPTAVAAHTGAATSYGDPTLDPSFPFMSDECRDKFATLKDGRLDWGRFAVLPAGTAVPAPAASLEQFSWSYARDVAANPISMANGEAEKFLFYRGLGEFELPVSVKSSSGGKVALKNDYAESIGRVFVVNVDAERGAFTEHTQGIAPGGVLDDTAPSLASAPGIDAYAEELAGRVTSALGASGLYDDEARAMVNTWKRQWFRTPGLRVLYLMPQSWTEASIPLSISPKPEQTLRVMLIRVELITPEQEAADVAAVKSFDAAPQVAAAYFDALGRFEEPRLRRALVLWPSAGGSQYLASIQSKAAALMGE